MFKDGKDDSGRFSGVVSSSGSPRIGFSRSSSRLSFQDDLDDCEFSCPFAVDDVDSSDSQTRYLFLVHIYRSCHHDVTLLLLIKLIHQILKQGACFLYTSIEVVIMTCI